MKTKDVKYNSGYRMTITHNSNGPGAQLFQITETEDADELLTEQRQKRIQDALHSFGGDGSASSLQAGIDALKSAIDQQTSHIKDELQRLGEDYISVYILQKALAERHKSQHLANEP